MKLITFNLIKFIIFDYGASLEEMPILLVMKSFMDAAENQITLDSEAAIQRFSWEKLFRKYAANLQEKTHGEVRFQ